MSEHRRTLKAVQALQDNSLSLFGELMLESHISMRDDFENSLPEIDSLVLDSVALGAVGARMTGGGFGGCIVVCIHKNQFENWRSKLLARHSDAFFVC
jgi:galactokinase